MDDLRIQHEKENESLQTEIKDLKYTLGMREKSHTRQKDLFKKMAANAQSELDKARAVISNLSEGIKACEGKSYALGKLFIHFFFQYRTDHKTCL